MNGNAACELYGGPGSLSAKTMDYAVFNANYTNNPVITCEGTHSCSGATFYNCHASSTGTLTVYGPDTGAYTYSMYLSS